MIAFAAGGFAGPRIPFAGWRKDAMTAVVGVGAALAAIGAANACLAVASSSESHGTTPPTPPPHSATVEELERYETQAKAYEEDALRHARRAER